MNKFNFGLQKVLDFKLSIEEKKKEEYIRAQKSYYSQEMHLKELKKQKEDEINTTRTLKNSFEFQTYTRYLDFLEQKIQGETEKLVALAEALKSKQLELLKSTSDRKTIENLKDKARVEFDLEVERQEQKLNDDYAMLSYLKQERR